MIPSGHTIEKEMRKLLYAAFIAVCLTLVVAACSDKKPAEQQSPLTDSIVDTTATDTMEELIEEQPIPKAADELFDDFIFNFAGNRKQQLARILFPLTVKTGETVKKIQRKEWAIDHFFMTQGYYTLILDNRKQLNLPKDTSVSHVVLEKINLTDGEVKQYNFDRREGKWMLTSLSNVSMDAHGDASFLRFYQRFATDSLFQAESLNETVSFSGPNPDDDFEELVGDITPEQWPAFSPGELPSGMIYNIIYGKPMGNSHQKIFMLRGISNGQEMEMTFKRVGDHWKLFKLVE